MMDAAEHKPGVKVLETMDKAVAQATRAGQIIRRMRTSSRRARPTAPPNRSTR